MSSLPDRTRPRLTQPARGLARTAARALGHGTWRLLHPRARSRFVEAPRPERLGRLYYETRDGWRAPLLRLPVRPGASGEPVLVAHALGASSEALRYGAGEGLAGALRDAGFAVYLWSHRADRDALPPSDGARRDVGFDAIVGRDLPAAVERVLDETGARRVLFVGHGLGGQAGLCWAAGRPDGVAGVVAVAAPMRFGAAGGGGGPRSAPLRLASALALVPAAWRVPLRAAARLATPWVGDEDAGAVPGDRARGLLAYGADDPPVGLLRELLAWHEHGGPTSGAVDWCEALAGATAPALLVCAEGDTVCPPAAALAALDRWGGVAHALTVPGLDHHGLLFGAAAPDAVFAPVIAWLLERRANCWLDASTDASLIDVGAVG